MNIFEAEDPIMNEKGSRPIAMNNESPNAEGHEAILYRSVLTQIVGGRNHDELLAELKTRLPEAEAERLLAAAAREHKTARKDGTHIDLEHNLHFDKPPTAARGNDWLGLGLLALGVGASILSYLTAMPGQSYALYVGFIAAGAYRLFLR